MVDSSDEGEDEGKSEDSGAGEKSRTPAAGGLGGENDSLTAWKQIVVKRSQREAMVKARARKEVMMKRRKRKKRSQRMSSRSLRRVSA